MQAIVCFVAFFPMKNCELKKAKSTLAECGRLLLLGILNKE